MTTRKITRFLPSMRLGALILAAALIAGLMAGCNLGAAGNEPGPAPTTPGGIILPQDQVLPTNTVPVVIPATVTPTPQPLPSEVLGPITVNGTALKTTEPVTITVIRGKSVGTVTCNWVLQGTARTGTLATPTSAAKDENTFTDTYTFTPDAAGTYQINCTGIATTASGQRAVSATGTPFPVEAKG